MWGTLRTLALHTALASPVPSHASQSAHSAPLLWLKDPEGQVQREQKVQQHSL